MKEILNTFIEDALEKLKTAQSNLKNRKENSITIDSKYFDKKYIDKEDVTGKFIQLKTIKNPVLYWFEINSSDNNEAIREKYLAYREPMKKNFSATDYRNTSSYKKKYSSISRTLYVGKVETGFWGRVVTHLGYNKSKKTAGMQLFHWYNPVLFGNIKLNYIEFEPNMKHLIIILEKQLAKDLEPLIGRY